MYNKTIQIQTQFALEFVHDYISARLSHTTCCFALHMKLDHFMCSLLFLHAMTLILDVKVMGSAYLLKFFLLSEQGKWHFVVFFGWAFSVADILHLTDQIKWLNLNFVVLQNLIHQPLTFIYFKICFVTGINKKTRFFSNYLYSLRFWQQRKYSADVIMCSTKALLLLKKHCTFSSSCFHELKSIRHTIFPFHSLLRFNISYFKHNGIHTPSKPVQQESSSMHSTCLCFKSAF